MAITQAAFDNEMELQTWVIDHVREFLPGTVFMPGCQVTTISGKSGVPDGYAFNFADRQWYVIENELLGHGVWPHIAEQVVRFVVAMKNSEARRKIRDRLFDQILSSKQAADVCSQLNTTSERLHQQLELFIEGVDPQIAIFIDETNQDLRDMAHALDSETKIFRVQKFLTDTGIDYHSPDRHNPAVVTEPDPPKTGGTSDYDVIEKLGGGSLHGSIRQFRCYKLDKGEIIHIKRSKFHESNNNYWYGITPVSREYASQFGVTHFVFVMGNEGFVKASLDTIDQIIANTGTSLNEDGTVKHHHCFITQAPAPEMYGGKTDSKVFDMTDAYYTL